MEEINFEKLQELNVDVENTMDRFLNNEVLYLKFLKKFLLDENYNKLAKAMQDKNLDAAIQYSHTLKGLTGNLGIKGMYQMLAQMLDHLRSGEFEEAENFMPKLSENYVAICRVIREM